MCWVKKIQILFVIEFPCFQISSNILIGVLSQEFEYEYTRIWFDTLDTLRVYLNAK